LVRDTLTPTVDVAHDQQPSVLDDESTATAQGAIAFVVALATPVQGEEKKAVDEVRLYHF
jgi:hypothetical protein